MHNFPKKGSFSTMAFAQGYSCVIFCHANTRHYIPPLLPGFVNTFATVPPSHILHFRHILSSTRQQNLNWAKFQMA